MHVAPIVRPAGTFNVTVVGLAPSYSAVNGSLITPITLNASTMQPGTLTYTWSAYGYLADDATPEEPPISVGTGNGLSWQPDSTPGLIDIVTAQRGAGATPAGQRIHVQVHVVDASNNTADNGTDFYFVYVPG
jgi:hypothetical protein